MWESDAENNSDMLLLKKAERLEEAKNLDVGKKKIIKCSLLVYKKKTPTNCVRVFVLSHSVKRQKHVFNLLRPPGIILFSTVVYVFSDLNCFFCCLFFPGYRTHNEKERAKYC